MFLTDAQHSIQQVARDFAQSTVKAQAKAIETSNDALMACWKTMAQMGFTGLAFPETYDGAGADYLSYCLLIEELARVSGSLAVMLSVHTTVGILPIYQYGTEAQKQKYLPPLMRGEQIAAFGLTEPGAGSDAGAGDTKATLNGNGHYYLDGSKIFITNAQNASIFVLTARTEAGVSGNKGLSAFVLERDTEGFSIAPGDEKLGIKGSDWGTLNFDHVPVPADQLLGQPGEGFKVFMNSLDSGRVSIGAMSLGIAQGCLDEALKYAQQRRQFNKPISDFQAIQFKLADMATQIEAARHLVYQAARLKDLGKPFALEGSMAKLYASQVAWRCANEAIQIHGGYGYTTDFPVERYWRDARCLEIVEGTSEVQRLVIARQLLHA